MHFHNGWHCHWGSRNSPGGPAFTKALHEPKSGGGSDYVNQGDTTQEVLRRVCENVEERIIVTSRGNPDRNSVSYGLGLERSNADLSCH